jgi:hypothetical protein
MCSTTNAQHGKTFERVTHVEQHFTEVATHMEKHLRELLMWTDALDRQS